jgi:DNA polymerase elongation subunit (family B)
MSPGKQLDYAKLRWLLWAVELVSFNGNRYDVPLLSVAIVGGVDTHALKQVSDNLIISEFKPRDIERDWHIKIENYNHIDLIEVAPLQASLKKYAARMHAKRLQELPFSPHTELDEQQRAEVCDYCFTDLDNLQLLHAELAEQLALRVSLSAQYGQDLRSKSDAQLAEAIFVSRYVAITGRYPKKPTFEPGDAFEYDAPEHISFQTQEFRDALMCVQDAIFVLDANGSPRCPALQELTLRLGSSVYAMGLGGLHSREACRAIYADAEHGLVDIDVTGYYPALMLAEKIRPEAMGETFGIILRDNVDRRTAAKRRVALAEKEGQKPDAQDQTEADSLKITNNGTFGKTGSQYSAMFAPKGMIQVTLTGQLSILMLIEKLHLQGFEVASGNTDGILVRYPLHRKAELDHYVNQWEIVTQLTTEETSYAAIFNRDVNNYIAVKKDGKVKVKGVYAEKGSTGNTRLSKNPQNLICSDAVIALLTAGTPIAQTVAESKDFTRFVSVRDVKGGGECAGVYLGKVVRWYYAKGARTTINYVGSGNKVAETDNVKPCMDLPDSFPEDLDHDRYIAEANAILCEIGHTKPQGALF